MGVDYLAILACGVASLVLGFVWYGPLFGKKWMEIIGATAADRQARKEMQSKAMPLYVITFVLSLFQAYVLSLFISGWQEVPGVENAIWIWAAFIVPTMAAVAMWNNDSSRIAWARFLIGAGYYLVLFITYGIILVYWPW